MFKCNRKEVICGKYYLSISIPCSFAVHLLYVFCSMLTLKDKYYNLFHCQLEDNLLFYEIKCFIRNRVCQTPLRLRSVMQYFCLFIYGHNAIVLSFRKRLPFIHLKVCSTESQKVPFSLKRNKKTETIYLSKSLNK